MAEPVRGGEWPTATAVVSQICEPYLPVAGSRRRRRRNLADCSQKLRRRSQSQTRHQHSCFNCRSFLISSNLVSFFHIPLQFQLFVIHKIIFR